MVLFRATPVLLITNKSDKVNDQGCLSFCLLIYRYLFTSSFQFSIDNKGNLEKLYFVAQKYSGIRRTPSFEKIFDQISIFSRKKFCALQVDKYGKYNTSWSFFTKTCQKWPFLGCHQRV